MPTIPNGNAVRVASDEELIDKVDDLYEQATDYLRSAHRFWDAAWRARESTNTDKDRHDVVVALNEAQAELRAFAAEIRSLRS